MGKTKKEQKATGTAEMLPGWQILIKSAEAVMSGTADLLVIRSFLANVIARKDEIIPKEHWDEAVAAILAAGKALYHVRWDNDVTDFLCSQCGQEKLNELLVGSGFLLHSALYIDGASYYIEAEDAVERLNALMKREAEKMGEIGVAVLEINPRHGRKPNEIVH